MSIALMTAAFKTDLPSTQKFVLVALADSANDQGECYPSVTALMAKCSLSDRGVQAAIRKLEADQQLHREFRNGRSTVYWIHPRTTFTPERSSPPNVVHPAPEPPSPPPPNVAHPTPERGSPITINETSEETSGKQKKPRKRDDPLEALKPDDVNDATWRDWCALRKAKRAGVSETVITGAREEADLAGMSLEAFLRVWVLRGSQGLQASWLTPRERSDGKAVAAPNKQEALEARNRAVGQRWAASMQQQEIDDAAA